MIIINKAALNPEIEKDSPVKIGDYVKIGTITGVWSEGDEEYWRNKVCKVVDIEDKKNLDYSIWIKPVNGGRCICFSPDELILLKGGLVESIYGD